MKTQAQSHELKVYINTANDLKVENERLRAQLTSKKLTAPKAKRGGDYIPSSVRKRQYQRKVARVRADILSKKFTNPTVKRVRDRYGYGTATATNIITDLVFLRCLRRFPSGRVEVIS